MSVNYLSELHAAGASDEELDFARAGSVDFSGGAGIRALKAAGAEGRIISYAIADAEWRHGGPIAAEAVVTANGRYTVMPNVEVITSGDGDLPKLGYETSMPPEARDSMADFASRCEGKGPAWSVDGTSVAVIAGLNAA